MSERRARLLELHGALYDSLLDAGWNPEDAKIVSEDLLVEIAYTHQFEKERKKLATTVKKAQNQMDLLDGITTFLKSTKDKPDGG